MKTQNQEGLLINHDEETNKSCPYSGIPDENEELKPVIVKNKLKRCDHENCFSTLLHMSTKKFRRERMKTRVSIRGVKSLWVERRFIPADHWVICAICSF